jgi:hypothetical protein
MDRMLLRLPDGVARSGKVTLPPQHQIAKSIG